jgi:hypothetical protein
MARTTEEIYNATIEAKATFAELDGLAPGADDAQTLLTDLGNETNVADWRLWTYLYSYAQSLLEQFFDIFKAEIKEIGATSHFGTLPWWRQAARQFQYGYDLLWDETLLKFKYATVDEDSQIIKRAASTSYPDTQEVVIKVAKADGEPLTAPEKAAFEAYCIEIAAAGINTTVISQVADDFKVDIEIFYDPLVMADNGSLLSDPAIFPVEDAILNHLSSLDFNGEIVKTFLQDEIQKADGVVNPVIRFAYSRVGAAPYSEIGDKQQAFSGQFRIDPLVAWADQLTYTADV